MYKAIHTVPRSGTYWMAHFFSYYEKENNLKSEHKMIFRGLGAYGIKKKLKKGASYYKLNVELMHRHMLNETPEHPVVEFESKKDISRLAKEINSSLKNCSARIVFVYRNPFSQAISHFNHLQKRLDKSDTVLAPSNKALNKCLSISEHLDSFRLTYANFYLSHTKWETRLPECILMVPYEELKKNPVSTFSKIINFLDPDIFDLELVKKTVAKTTVEKLQNVEKELGGSLAGEVEGSHIQNKDPINWKKYFTQEVIEDYFKRMLKDGIDLTCFME